MKKIAIFILALALTLSMTATAFALNNKGYCGNVEYEIKMDDGLKTVIFSFDNIGIADGVIEGDMFIGNSDIQKIIIEEGITEIGSQVFKNMKNLKVVYIPASVAKMASDAFDGCTSLKDIHYAGSQPEIVTYGSFISDGCIYIIAAVVVVAAAVAVICIKKKKKA